jgi:hypothetical protein
VAKNEDGQYNFNQDMAVFRLCPSDSGCDSDKTGGCSDGYGDYVVDLNSYVQAYFEDQGENMQGDDAFRPEEYSECSAYEVGVEEEEAAEEAAEEEGEGGEGEAEQGEGKEDGNRKKRKLKRKLEQGSGYYIGPTCTDDGTDVKLELFTDYECSVVSEDVSFDELSGMSLPYSSGGLVSTSCISCYGANDNGEYEVSELCTGLYEVSYGCESKMETYSANGKDESHCAYIEQLNYVKSSGGTGAGTGTGTGLVIFYIILGIAVVGAGGYFFYQKNSESLCVCLYCCKVAMYLTSCHAFVNTDKTVKGSVDSDGLMADK